MMNTYEYGGKGKASVSVHSLPSVFGKGVTLYLPHPTSVLPKSPSGVEVPK